MPGANTSKWVQPTSVASLIVWLASDAGKDVNGAVIRFTVAGSETGRFPLGTLVTHTVAPFLMQFNIPAIFSNYHGESRTFDRGVAGGIAPTFTFRASAAGSRSLLPAARGFDRVPAGQYERRRQMDFSERRS